MTNEEAIKNIVAYMYFALEDIPEEVVKALDLAIEALKERPHGKWIMEGKIFDGVGDSVLVNTCSICKKSFVYRGMASNFCPNCGADMRGGEDHE